MKKDEIPQDPSPLDKFTKEVCYAVDEKGEYTTGLSRGWQIKADALGITWEEAQARTANAREKVRNGEASPIIFHGTEHDGPADCCCIYWFLAMDNQAPLETRCFQKSFGEEVAEICRGV